MPQIVQIQIEAHESKDDSNWIWALDEDGRIWYSPINDEGIAEWSEYDAPTDEDEA